VMFLSLPLAGRVGAATGWGYRIPFRAPTRPATLPTRSAGEGSKRNYASQRQSNSGESGGGDSSGVQPVNFSIE
jgi:hypothetical protein